jgi:ADP-ribosylglycohydrolase
MSAERVEGTATPAPERLTGLLLGLAVGDALGLPMEGLAPARIARRFPGPLRHRLLFGRGMVSDDTEHAIFTAQAVLQAPADVAAFRRALAWKLRGWFLGLPAGIGLATLRACVRLWLGFPRPGVFSAGNGPGMRAPVLGAYFAGDPARLAAYVRASTELTHTDPKALTGAMALATMAAWAVTHDGPPGWTEAQEMLTGVAPEDAAWGALVAAIGEGLAAGDDVPAFARRLGLGRGVTGYMYHTAPVALFAWLRHGGDYAAGVAGVVQAGGDTDSVAAMAGALLGATATPAGIPQAWVDGLTDWPRGVGVLRALGAARAPVRYPLWGVVPRNAAFTAIVLGHGLRRLLPPY